MSRLKEKSNINHESASILIARNLHASSIHCSYYSIFQLLKYVVHELTGDSYDEIANKTRRSGKGTHLYIKDEILKFVRDNRQEYRFFKNSIKDLKHFRVQSDYEDIDIDSGKSNESLRLATELREFINEKVKT